MIRIEDKSQCCGCSACVQRCPKQCISMEEDNEGFLYPKVNAGQCINCGLCEKVCPVINQNEPRVPLRVYAAKNMDENIRNSSSSGGMFTLLAEQIVKEGGVVFGACWDEEWNVRHCYAECAEDLAKFRSSKYLQSRIGDSYRQAEKFLKAGCKVMFTGTPCQIAGLRHFLRKEYDNLLAVDVVCHSVPSPGVWQQYLSEKLQSLKWEKPNIQRISFRDKRTGWKRYSFVIENKDGSVYSELGGKNAFMRGFLADLYIRPSCHACPAKELKSGSDLTLGDFWGIDTLMPEIDDDKGISAILVNTRKGGEVLYSIGIELHELSYDELIKRNQAVVRSCNIAEGHIEFFSERDKIIEEKVKTWVKKNNSLRNVIKSLMLIYIPIKIRQIIRMIKSKCIGAFMYKYKNKEKNENRCNNI